MKPKGRKDEKQLQKSRKCEPKGHKGLKRHEIVSKNAENASQKDVEQFYPGGAEEPWINLYY